MEQYNKGYIQGYKDAQKEFEKYYLEAIGALQRFTKLIPKKSNLKVIQPKLSGSESYLKFIDWIKTDCPNVYKHFTTLPTEDEFIMLKAKDGGKGKKLMDILRDLNNYNKINKYRNLTRTLNNWMR